MVSLSRRPEGGPVCPRVCELGRRAARSTSPTRSTTATPASAAGAGSCDRGTLADLSARGNALYRPCAACHGPDGSGNRELGAPAIAGLDSWYVAAQLRKFKSGARGSHPDDPEGARMRPMAQSLTSEDDVLAVAEHIAQMPPQPAPAVVSGDEARGRSLWTICAGCHGASASGSRASGAPPLDLASDWYLVVQLGKFRRGVRGAHPDDATGAVMRTVALGLPDERAMRDVVAYIATLR